MDGAEEGVVVDADGSARCEGERTRAALGAQAGRYALITAAGGMLMLRRTDDTGGEEASDGSGVLMAGQLLSRTSAAEIVSLIAQSGWRGELALDDGKHQRRLGLDQGVLRSASSNAPGELLGEVMLALGALDPAQLQACLDDARGQRLGEVAVRRGLMSQQRAFELLGKQAQRVFDHAMLSEGGHYCFVRHGSDTTGAADVTLHLPVQGLLMESMQRVDEMAVFRERIPSGDMRPAPTADAGKLALADSLRPVAALIDGRHSVLDIARALSLDEFQATKLVAQLLSVGYAELHSPALDESAAFALVERFNIVLARVGEAVAARTQDSGDCMLRQGMGEGPLLALFGAALRADGTLDPAATLRGLHANTDEHGVHDLHRALHELTSFAIFAAGPVLNRDNERDLMSLVQLELSAR